MWFLRFMDAFEKRVDCKICAQQKKLSAKILYRKSVNIFLFKIQSKIFLLSLALIKATSIKKREQKLAYLKITATK